VGRVVPTDIEERLATWNRRTFRLRILSVVLATVGVIASVLVASNWDETDALWKRVMALVAAIAAVLLASLELAGKSDGTRRARRHLNGPGEPDERLRSACRPLRRGVRPHLPTTCKPDERRTREAAGATPSRSGSDDPSPYGATAWRPRLRYPAREARRHGMAAGSR
jgi:hypothetical protein